jgi:hypothetical protein
VERVAPGGFDNLGTSREGVTPTGFQNAVAQLSAITGDLSASIGSFSLSADSDLLIAGATSASVGDFTLSAAGSGPAPVQDDYSWIPFPGGGDEPRKRKKRQEPEPEYTEPVVPPLPRITPRKVEVPSIAPALALIAERKRLQVLRAKQARRARELEDDDEEVLLLM